MKIYRFLLKLLLLINLCQDLLATPWPSEGAKFIPESTPKHHVRRKGSQPFISADSFRSICDHICDETDYAFNPANVKAGDTIYITSYIAAEFFNLAHPKITAPYILVAHNGDISNPNVSKQMLDDPKLIKWFGINCDLPVLHPKFVPIPIGLANRYWAHGNIEIVDNVVKNLAKYAKKRLACVSFTKNTNGGARWPAFNFFQDKSYCTTFINNLDHNRKDLRSYLIDMAESKFVVSPHGNGLDCHRTWEALLVGSFPIVKISTLDPLYQDLPVLIVKDWSDATEEFLNQQYKIMCQTKYNLEKIYFKYWEDLIKNTQRDYRR